MSLTTPKGVETWRSSPRPWGLGDLVSLGLWTAALAFFFWEAVSLQKAFFYFDITEINYPYRDFLAREIRLGRFSRWIPGLYNGMPLYSESQAGYWHPLKYLLYPWLKTWQAFNLDTILSIWLTGLGTFGWLRRHVNPLGALTGAAIFGLSGFVWAHLIHTSMINALISVPLVVWATEYAWDRGRVGAIVPGALALAAEVFAGHLQDTLFTAGLIGLYTLFRAATEKEIKRRLSVIGLALGIVTLGVLLSAVQWVPSKALLDRSPRRGGLSWEDLTYGSWSPELLPAMVIREAYGTRALDTDWMDGFYPYHEMNAYLGLTALGLAAIGAGAFRDRWVAFWIILAAIGSVLMLGRFTLLFDHANKLPIFGSSRIPVRFHLWVALAVAALAGVGVDRLERGFPVRLRAAAWLVGVILVSSLAILCYVYAPIYSTPDRWKTPYHLARFRWLGNELTIATTRALLIGLASTSAIITALRSRRWRRLACGVLPVLVIADLLGSHWYEAPTINPSYWTSPPKSARILRADPSFVRLAFVRMYRNEPSSGEPGYASIPLDFPPIRDTLGWSLAPVWGLKSLGGETPLLSRRMVKFTDQSLPGTVVYDLASVTHLITNRLNPLRLDHAIPAGSALIYPNPDALPRARIMGQPVYAQNVPDAIAAMNRLGQANRQRLVVEDPDRPISPETPVSGAAKIVRDDPEEVVIDAEATAPAYLVLADSHDPGWTATVDGRPAPIRPAVLTLRAVFIAKGRHRVVFRYRPEGFQVGLEMSLLGLVLSMVLIAWPRRLPTATPPHEPLEGSKRWFWIGPAAMIVLVLASLVAWDRDGHLRWSTRWRTAFHQFTWGAGFEAMRPRPDR